MRVWFYGFNKRVNSTKQPPGDTEWSPEVLLKEPVSFYNPVLRVGVQTGANVTRHNYLRIDNVCGVSHAYYFIDNWVSIREDIYECTCTMDLLATYKEYILATTAYVEYSDSAGNALIPDRRVALSPSPVRQYARAAFSPEPSGGGSYILHITGKESTGFYALSQNALTGLLDSLTDWGNSLFPGSYGDDFSGVVNAVLDGVRQLVSSGDVGKNISSCTWVPWQVTGTSTPLWLGNFETGKAGRAVTLENTPNIVNLTYPGQTGTWLDSANCLDLGLYLPYAGMVSISASAVFNSTLTVEYSVQQATGAICYAVASGGTLIGTYGGNAGVSVPLGVGVVNGAGAMGVATAGAGLAAAGMVTAGAGATATVAGGALALALADSLTGENLLQVSSALGTQLGSFANDMGARYFTMGGAGNGAAAGISLNTGITLSGYRYSPISDPSILGKPTMSTLSLSGMSGYVKTVGASVQAPTGKDQLVAINTSLDGGIYIE